MSFNLGSHETKNPRGLYLRPNIILSHSPDTGEIGHTEPHHAEEEYFLVSLVGIEVGSYTEHSFSVIPTAECL